MKTLRKSFLGFLKNFKIMPQEFSIFIASKLFGDIKMFSHGRATAVAANGIRLQLFISF